MLARPLAGTPPHCPTARASPTVVNDAKRPWHSRREIFVTFSRSTNYNSTIHKLHFPDCSLTLGRAAWTNFLMAGLFVRAKVPRTNSKEKT